METKGKGISIKGFFRILIPALFVCSISIYGATFYVASNGSDTAPYDTWEKGATTIQTAINAASAGDTIIVGSSDGHGTGSYTENVIVNKEVVIQSENGNSTTTVIADNSDSYVFEVTSNNVTINGFSIYGATGFAKAGIYLSSVNNCTISNNRCGWDASYKNNRGIHLNTADTCTISNNTASYNDGEGIYMESSDENNLSSNVANNNTGDGISLASSSNNTLSGNTTSSNGADGIHMVPSATWNTLSNNTASSNGNNGILMVASSNNTLTGNTTNSNQATHGIYLVSATNNNTLTNNTANSNMGNGIRLETNCTGNNLSSNTVNHNEFGIFLSECSYNTIDSNNMDDNDGRVDGDGIMLSGSSYNTISNNSANNDPGDGVEFYEASNNNIIGNTVINSGWGIRINYHSSNNVISGNTVNEGVKGIVLEEGNSKNNVVANNITNDNSEDGIYLYNSTADNILIGNTAKNNTDYGIHLNTTSGNSIYLNNLSANSSGNVLSENGSTNSWSSPTTIYYDYKSGTFHKGYLGNYYSDGTHTGSNGIDGTYTIANDNDDAYQLIDTSANFALQAWWLKGDDIMYCNDPANSGDSVTISNGGNNIWKADQAALQNINFDGSGTWTGEIRFVSAPTNGHTFSVEIGYSTDGSDFTAGGPDATITGDGSSTRYIFTTDASAFTVTAGKYLALKITSNNGEYSLMTGGAWSFISSSENSPDYALPVELFLFTAEVSGEVVLLNWQTATELNNYGFEIERASVAPESKRWEKIGFVSGNGTNNNVSEYSFVDENPVLGQVCYRLKQIDIDGKYEYSPEIEVNYKVVYEFALSQNYPNPFNPTTNISFKLAERGKVSIKIFNAIGQEVAELVNKPMEAGKHEITFNASNLPSGAYFCRMTAGNFTKTSKMLLIK